MIISCAHCSVSFKRKPSEINSNGSNFCSRRCRSNYKLSSNLEHKRIKKFIKSSWTNMNLRCGKYKHLQTKSKCKSYKNINIEFVRKDFDNWCFKNKNIILTLDRPSIDRKDSNCNYSLDNIQIIELINNIAKEKLKFDGILRQCYKCKDWKLPKYFYKTKCLITTNISSICKICDKLRKKQSNKGKI